MGYLVMYADAFHHDTRQTNPYGCLSRWLCRLNHRGRKGGGTSYFLSALSLFAHARRTIDVDRFQYFSCL